MALDKNTFGRIIDAMPLVSIDLIVRNECGEVLLGRRRNRPAQGFWFVPGGRIRKGESLEEALARIAQAELGMRIRAGRLLGAFDHFYHDNVFGIEGVSTHYVALGYECELRGDSRFVPDAQHEELRWWDPRDLLTDSEVHPNAKRYFEKTRDGGWRCACPGEFL